MLLGFSLQSPELMTCAAVCLKEAGHGTQLSMSADNVKTDVANNQQGTHRREIQIALNFVSEFQQVDRSCTLW